MPLHGEVQKLGRLCEELNYFECLEDTHREVQVGKKSGSGKAAVGPCGQKK